MICPDKRSCLTAFKNFLKIRLLFFSPPSASRQASISMPYTFTRLYCWYCAILPTTRFVGEMYDRMVVAAAVVLIIEFIDGNGASLAVSALWRGFGWLLLGWPYSTPAAVLIRQPAFRAGVQSHVATRQKPPWEELKRIHIRIWMPDNMSKTSHYQATTVTKFLSRHALAGSKYRARRAWTRNRGL